MRRFGLVDRRAFVAGGLVLPFLGRTAFGQASATTEEAMDPGSYLWQPELAPEGPVVIIVSIPEQRVYVYRNGIQIGVSTCSTGKPGHSTPTGVFVVLQKDKNHHSSTYNNAPMPNMQRLTWSGIALHAGDLPGYPASHGCVRLPMEFSKLIFGITQLGIPVIIADEKSQPEVVVHPGFILPTDAQDQAAAAVLAAKNDTANAITNVVSGVVSAADQKAIMLIDGQVAWESAITIAEPKQPLGSTAFTLLGLSPDGSAFRWQAHDIDGDRQTVTKKDPVLSRITVEKADEVTAILEKTKPGAIVVVTDEAADQDNRTAPGFVIIDAEVTA
jgi:hypothetical protein